MAALSASRKPRLWVMTSDSGPELAQRAFWVSGPNSVFFTFSFVHPIGSRTLNLIGCFLDTVIACKSQATIHPLLSGIHCHSHSLNRYSRWTIFHHTLLTTRHPPPQKEKVQTKQKAYLLTSHEVTTTKLPPQVKVLVVLCNPIDCSPSGFPVHGILQARTLEWISHSLLQASSLTQGLNLGLSHCRQILPVWASRSAKAALLSLSGLFPPISSEIISAIKNGYFHGELSYYFTISIHESVECHHSSEEAHLQTQAHSLTPDPRWQSSIRALWS